jgi:hypothetical protein
MGVISSMDTRYVILGLSILSIMAGFIIYGLYTGMESLIGVALSLAVLGGVFVTVGYTYHDPLSDVLLKYSDLISQVVLKIYEDLELLGREKIHTCLRNDGVLVVYARNNIPCSDVEPGFGLYRNTPYIAFLLKKEGIESSEPREVISSLGLADNVVVFRDEKHVSINLSRLRKELLRDGWKPLNPIQVLVPAYLSLSIGSDLVCEKEEFNEGIYRAVYRVVGRK